MKVIFLDIDGVLNVSNSAEKTPLHYDGVESDKVALLKQIVDRTNASIVLISSWKHEWDKDSSQCFGDAPYLNARLAEHGLTILDKTEGADWNRGVGIQQYLEEHDVESYVILDDEQWGSFSFEMNSRHVQTNLHEGLTPLYVEQACECLNISLSDSIVEYK